MSAPHQWHGDHWTCLQCGQNSDDPCVCLCHDDVCYTHHRREPELPGDYKVCGECCHVWRTEIEFRTDEANAHNSLLATYPNSYPFMKPEDVVPGEVYSCPLCTHDF